MAIIYGIRNTINNKIYIGSTNNFMRRKSAHFCALKIGNHKNEYLQRSYNKYGKNSFVMFEIIKCDDSVRIIEELNYINQHQSFLPKCGYNMYVPDGDKFACGQTVKDKLRKNSIESKRSVPIDMYSADLGFIESFDCMKDCKKKYNIPQQVISNIINGKNNRLSYNGFTFFHRGDIPILRKSNKQRNMKGRCGKRKNP